MGSSNYGLGNGDQVQLKSDVVQVVSQASSGGRALRGLFLTPMTMPEHELYLLGSQVLLDPPRGLPLMSENNAFSTTYWFSGSEESTSFCRDVKRKGWSVATRLSSPRFLWAASPAPGDIVVGGSFEINSNKLKMAQESLTRKFSEVSMTHCVYVSQYCFQIPRSKMMLCEDALARACAVRSQGEADDFLRNFGSHVSESCRYCLGGVLFRKVTVKYREEISLFDIMSQEGNERKVNAMSQVLPIAEGLASGSRNNLSETMSNKSSKVMDKQTTENVVRLGFAAIHSTNIDEVLHNLKEKPVSWASSKLQAEDPRSWAIIDIHKDLDENNGDGLVGVWDLLLQHAKLPASNDDDALRLRLTRAAELLCKRWLDLASPSPDSPLYFKLISTSKVFLAQLSVDPMLREQPARAVHVLPLSLSHREATLEGLVTQLERLADKTAKEAGSDYEHLDVGQEVANEIRFYIKKAIPGTSEKSAQNHQSALQIFAYHGFNEDGNMVAEVLQLTGLKIMIKELKEIQNPPATPALQINPSAWLGHADMGSLYLSSIQTLASASQLHTRLVGDVVVDRKFHCNTYPQEGPRPFRTAQHATPEQNFQEAATRHMIDCLRHRLDPVSNLLQVPGRTSRANFSDDSEDEDAAEEKELDAIKQVSPLQLLMKVLEGSDLPAQIAVCDLLLSQRAATPLAFPLISPNSRPECQHVVHDQGVSSASRIPSKLLGHWWRSPKRIEDLEDRSGGSQLTHYIQVLGFVEVTLLAKEGNLCIANDTTHCRVVFLSDRSVEDSHAAIVASRALQCDFISQHNRKYMGQLITPVIEVGVGFVDVPKQGKSHNVACLAFHVVGSYHQLLDFIKDIADVIVLELEERNTNHSCSQLSELANYNVLQWRETGQKPHRKGGFIQGQETYIVQEIVQKIGKILASQVQVEKCRQELTEVCTRHFFPQQLINFKELELIVGECNFTTLRNRLCLQKSFIHEARAHFESLQQKDNPSKKRAADIECREQRRIRSGLAKEVQNNALMQLFHQLLDLPDASARRIGVMWLEKTLTKNMFPILEEASRRVDTTYELSQNRLQHRSEYIKAKQEYTEKTVGLQNLWRELCHIFENDSENQRNLAKKAAQHLLDGFPLEILDGDAGMLCELWMQSVLTELDTMTKAKAQGKSARIFILSVIGMQSSGKSTMLNLMFGTQLQTSAGRCTRGVYMQLVPAERDEYDYVVLLDTEGLRSPEYFGLEASEVRDNRIATFGLLPADASIFMVSNEDDNGLKEVLPMALLAFKGSAIAAKYGSRIKAKMTFVYRGVDTNNTMKLKANERKLLEYLREAAVQVNKLGSSFTKEEDHVRDINEQDLPTNELLRMLLIDFRVSGDEAKSDVKYMGSLKTGTVPPKDTPDWAYGERVIELREYIHDRVMQDGWEPATFTNWGEKLSMVWECICSADFELSFRNAVEYNSYKELQVRLQAPRTELLMKYKEVFELLEMRMKPDEGSIATIDTLVNKLVDDMHKYVCGTEEVQDKEVKAILEMKNYAKWRPQELFKWGQFCVSKKQWYRKRIVDLVKGVVMFGDIVASYEKQIKATIVSKRKHANGERKLESDFSFEEYFDALLEQAEKEHPQVKNEVPSKVTGRYNEAGLLNQYPSSSVQVVQPSSNNCFAFPHLHFLKVPKTDSLFSSMSRDNRNKENLESTLRMIINNELLNETQYSDVAVDRVISKTTEAINAAKSPLSKKDKNDNHMFVKDVLTKRMQDIQSQWDKDHNVVEKLKLNKPRLLWYFEAQTKGLEAANMLVMELQRILEDELEETQHMQMEKKVTARLGKAGWVIDGTVMRAFLDYHLLTLMKERKTSKLLWFVTNQPSHFTAMRDALILQSIDREVWETELAVLLQKVEKCLRATIAENYSVGVFVNELAHMLAKDVDLKLGRSVMNLINVDDYKDVVLDSDFLTKPEVSGLFKSLRRKLSGFTFDNKREALAERVKKWMEGLHDENCGLRCQERCPICGSTCMIFMGHSTISQKHDCIHRPEGLGGMVWRDTNELIWKTCLESLEDECNLHAPDGRKLGFCDFEREFPDWAQPAKRERTAIQVQELIFFDYQDDLVQFYSSQGRGTIFKPCRRKDMQKYNHNADNLRTKVKNKLRSVLPDDDAWKQFEQLLQSI